MVPSKVQLEADLHAMIADMPTAVTLPACADPVRLVQTKDCSKTVMAAADLAAAAGELEGYRFSLHAVISDWEPVPIDGDLLTVAAKEYRIIRSNDDVAGVRWDMGDKYTDRTR